MEALAGEEAPADLTAWELAGQLAALEEQPVEGPLMVWERTVGLSMVWGPLLAALVSLLVWAPLALPLSALPQWCPPFGSASPLFLPFVEDSPGPLCRFQPAAKRLTSRAPHQLNLGVVSPVASGDVSWVPDSVPQGWGAYGCLLPWKQLQRGPLLP